MTDRKGKVLLIGCGFQGKAISYHLSKVDAVKTLTLADFDPKRVDYLADYLKSPKVQKAILNATDTVACQKLMKEHEVAVSAVSYRFNGPLTKAAVAVGCSFTDLGGNNDVVAEQLALDAEAKKQGCTIIPDTGVAPGMVSLLCADAFTRLDEVDTVSLRVGGLPQKPRPPLGYKVTFSSIGLINEYKEPCIGLVDGRLITDLEAMGDLEEIEFPPPFGKMEAFNTSGGTSTLPQTYGGKLKNLTYKTIRYKGHQSYVKMMMDIGLMDEEPMDVYGVKVAPRGVLEKILEKCCADPDGKDLIILRATAIGKKGGVPKTVVYECLDYEDEKTGLTAMNRMTGFSAAIVAQMVVDGRVKAKGAVPQELCVPTDEYIRELRLEGIDMKVIEK